MENLRQRFIYLSILFFFSAFTGYAFITAALIGIYSAVIFLRAATIEKKIIGFSLLFQVLVVVLFAILYQVPEKTVCILQGSDISYFHYSVNLILKFFGEGEWRKRTFVLIGIGIIMPLIIALVRSQKQKFSRGVTPLILLIAFSAIYFVLNVLGRACMGADSALAPRYSIFLLPAFCAFYIFLTYKLEEQDWSKSLILLFIISFLFLRYNSTGNAYLLIGAKSGKIKNWENCYQNLHEIEGSCSGKEFLNPFASGQIPNAKEYLKLLREKQAGY